MSATKKRVLIVTQEMDPYLALSNVAEISKRIPQYLHDNGYEIRVLMPRFGLINERRHKLHEVVRLSGMNIIVDDDDYPLIIKVASLPGTRMQVYFLDNEEFFKRKEMFEDEDGKDFEDNADRMVFFCKGVVETVKKFGWPPDLIHCSGWITGLIPFYIKMAYKNEPLFQHSKIVYTIFNQGPKNGLNESFATKASINELSPDDLKLYDNGMENSLSLAAGTYADGVVFGDETLPDEIYNKFRGNGHPVLEYSTYDEMMPQYLDFVKGIINN